jgi:import receptor subunit TOM70
MGQIMPGWRRLPITLAIGFVLLCRAHGDDGSSGAAAAHYKVASQAFVEQRFETAIEELARSLAIDPKQLAAMRLLGLSYQLTGELEKAESTFLDATRLAPKDGESWFYLGRVYYIRNFFDRALPALQTAAKYLPNDSRVRECLALTLEARGDADGAQREYELAMRRLQGKQGVALTPYLNYGAFLLKMNRTAESERLLTSAAKSMPQSWRAHFELGKLFFQTDRFEGALSELKAALRCERTLEEGGRTHALLSQVYSRLGRDQEARAAAAEAER